jgi:hypothetical protein
MWDSPLRGLDLYESLYLRYIVGRTYGPVDGTFRLTYMGSSVFIRFKRKRLPYNTP